MYEGPLQTNVESVKTAILVLKVIQGHCFWCQSKPVYDFLLVINCNLDPLFRTVSEIWPAIGSKSQNFSNPSHLGPSIGVTRMEFLEKRYRA